MRSEREEEGEEKWLRKIQGAVEDGNEREPANKNRRGGVFYSQVFLPFEEGIPPSPLRKKIINTFAVAMPTRGLSLCSQLWAFLAVITHSSRALHNYPQSICTSIQERDWGMRSREAAAFRYILPRKRRRRPERSVIQQRAWQRITVSLNMTFAVTIRTCFFCCFSS